MHRGLFALALCGLGACEPQQQAPFLVTQPPANAVLDRCLTRVVSEPPSGEVKGQPVSHLAWRVNGGRETEARGTNVDVLGGNKASYTFGVQLVEGANSLELGRCDEFGVCDWVPHPLRVDNQAGAPDCRAAHAGQALLPGTSTLGGLTALPDGRVLAGINAGNGETLLVMLRPDATIDTSFGTMGSVKVPALGAMLALPHPAGGWLVSVSGYFARISAAGVLDLSFGTTQGVAGLKTLACPEGCLVFDAVADPRGGYLAAGVTPQTPGSAQLVPAVMHFDESLTVSNVRALDLSRAAPLSDYRSAAIDAQGNAVVMSSTFAVSSSGAALQLPPSTQHTGAAAVSGSTAVVARTLWDTAVSLEITFLGLPANPVRIPLGAAAAPDLVLARVGADGSTYVLATRNRAAEAGAFFPAPDASELLVARLRNGALDPTFGTAGVSTFTFAAAWESVSSESPHENARGLALDVAGAPWVLATSSVYGQGGTDPARNRAGATVTKLRP